AHRARALADAVRDVETVLAARAAVAWRRPAAGDAEAADPATDEARIGGSAREVVGRARAPADPEIRDADRPDPAAERGGGGRALGARAVQRAGALASGPLRIGTARRSVIAARHAGAGRGRADRGDAAALAVVEARDADADAARRVATGGGRRAVRDVGGGAGRAGAGREADRRRRPALGVRGASAARPGHAVADRLRAAALAVRQTS